MPNRPNPSGLPPTRASVPIALNRAREKAMEPIRAMLSKSGLTEQQWRILRVLDEHGPLDASRLAEKASLRLPSQTRIVQTLTEKGLVTRAPHTSDRRRQTVAITRAGRQVIADNLPEAIRIAARFEEVLGPDRLRLLLDILEDFDRL